MATLWVDTVLNISVASGGQAVVALDETGFTIQERRAARWTLLRTIVRLDVAPTVRDSGEGDQAVDIGIGVVSEEGFSAVPPVVPDSSVGLDFPIKGWVYRARHRIYAVAVDDQNVNLVRLNLDLRAKRLMANGRLALIVDSGNNQGQATAVALMGTIRALFLTP